MQQENIKIYKKKLLEQLNVLKNDDVITYKLNIRTLNENETILKKALDKNIVDPQKQKGILKDFLTPLKNLFHFSTDSSDFEHLQQTKFIEKNYAVKLINTFVKQYLKDISNVDYSFFIEKTLNETLKNSEYYEDYVINNKKDFIRKALILNIFENFIYKMEQQISNSIELN